MKFRVEPYSVTRKLRDVVYLSHDGWDDWFKFSTKYFVEYVDPEGARHEIGMTKIGRFGLLPAKASTEVPPGARFPSPPEEFQSLDKAFFSLGQDPEFYEALSDLGESFRTEFLSGLRDIAFDPELLGEAESEPVTRISLLRTVPLPTVRDQFNRLAHGGAKLTPYNFKFKLAYAKTDPVPEVEFKVDPGSTPRTNIHVLVGRNGVGKTTFLNRLAGYMVGAGRAPSTAEQGTLAADASAAISNLVSVSFSAFDSFEPLTVSQDRAKELTYHYVGLKKKSGKQDPSDSIKGPAALANEMTRSSRMCFEGARKERWLRGLRLLETDPIFSAAGISEVVADATDVEAALEMLGGVFRKLSSGHKVVLLTITKLVETVEEKSLVLLDEPEAHLHPPLLSAFMRALSDLLVNRNGLAIVATHSPVVLQEVPRTCVWKISRFGEFTTVRRPIIETFGENVGTLTNEVFGLEVMATGFHGLLRDAAIKHGDYEGALSEFNGQVGMEGRAVLRAITSELGIMADVGR